MPRFEPIGTLREANDRGYDCLVVSDATESYFPHFKQATLEMVVAQGAIVGWAALSSEVVAVWQPAAAVPVQIICSMISLKHRFGRYFQEDYR